METIYSSNIVPKLQTSITRTPLSPGIMTEQVGDHLQISTLDFILNTQREIHSEGPATFCIAIFLDGKGELSIDSGKALPIKADMTVVFHSTEPVSGRTVFAADSRIHCLDFRYSLEYLSTFGVAKLDRIIPMFEKNHSVAKVTMLAKKTSFKLKLITREILDCDMKGIARSLFLQGKALEVLAHILSGFEHTESPLKLSKADQEKIQRAITLLEELFDQPWTIASLAQSVGLNQSKLKQGFHLAVQSTMHNYLEEVRLTTAQHLLEQGHKVIDVCLATGYSTPSHFSKRFKQRFSIKPSQWKSRLSEKPATSGQKEDLT